MISRLKARVSDKRPQGHSGEADAKVFIKPVPLLKHYPHIDGLRAVAVLTVILFHFNLLGVSGGYVGVDVFFVISGFLITGILFDKMQKGQFSLLGFYERRARRILPPLFVTCALCLVGALVLFVPDDFVQFSKSLEGAAGFASNFIFARWVGYFATSATVKPLLHTWSLAVEEQFYVFFPLLLFGLDRAFSNRRKTFITSLYLVLGVSLALNLAWLATSPDRTFYLLHTRAWELMVGAVLVLHLQKIKLSPAAREAMGLAGAALLLACCFLYDRNTPFPGAAAIPPCIAAAAIIWSGLEGRTTIARFLSLKPAVAIGLVSYGMYLFHWPVLVFARYYLDHDPGTLQTVCCLLLIGILSIGSYKFIETPIRSGAVLASRKRVFQASLAGLVVMAVAGFWGIQSKGFPGRFNGMALAYAAGAQDKAGVADCSKNRDMIPSEGSMCRIGLREKKHPDFLLWGDSHAASLAPAVDVMARAAGASGWFINYAGCPALVKTERADNFIDYSCARISDEVLAIIKRNKIKNVLLVTRWDMYAEGWEKGGIETTREPLIAYAGAHGAITGPSAFAPAVRDTMRALSDLGVNIWIVKQVPPTLLNVPTALAKAVYLGEDPKALERPYADIVARRRPVNAAFDAAAQTYPLHFIDPAEQLCPNYSHCLIAANGHALYSDNSHLTTYGALWSKDMLTPFFTHLVK